MGQVGSRAIALGPIGQHELHSELICYSHTGSIYQPHKTHGVHTASPPQGTRGAYSHPHKTHGVHTARPTRHTGCIQPPPQVRTADSDVFFLFPCHIPMNCLQRLCDRPCAIRLKEFSHAHARSPNKLIGNTRSCPDECITLM